MIRQHYNLWKPISAWHVMTTTSVHLEVGAACAFCTSTSPHLERKQSRQLKRLSYASEIIPIHVHICVSLCPRTPYRTQASNRTFFRAFRLFSWNIRAHATLQTECNETHYTNVARHVWPQSLCLSRSKWRQTKAPLERAHLVRLVHGTQNERYTHQERGSANSTCNVAPCPALGSLRMVELGKIKCHTSNQGDADTNCSGQLFQFRIIFGILPSQALLHISFLGSLGFEEGLSGGGIADRVIQLAVSLHQPTRVLHSRQGRNALAQPHLYVGKVRRLWAVSGLHSTIESTFPMHFLKHLSLLLRMDKWQKPIETVHWSRWTAT